MIELFSDIPSAIENTYQIAKRCNVSLQLGTYFYLIILFLMALPSIPILSIYPKKV
jgi:DNA polymerase III alpha subunit